MEQVTFDIAIWSLNGAILFAAYFFAGLIYAFSGYFYWKAILVCMVGYIFGNWIGAGLATRNGARFIRPVYFCVLAFLFLKLIGEAI